MIILEQINTGFFINSKEKMTLKKYARMLGITIKKDLGGAWFIDFDKPPNYASIPKENETRLIDKLMK